MARSKLSAAEAQEFSASLGKAAAGDYELMDFAIHTLRVPEALGKDAAQWVESIGGYVRMNAETRREAVRELSEDGKTNTQIAAILGITRQTVIRDLDVLAVTPVTPQGQIGVESVTPVTPGAKPPPVAEQRPLIRKMIDAKKSDAEIAVALNRGVATIGKERTAYNQEKLQAEVKAAKNRKDALGPSKAERKAAEAEFGEYVSEMRKGITEAFGITPLPSLMEADEELRQVLDNDSDFAQYDVALRLWAEIGRNLWVYGAKRGHDVSEVVRLLETLAAWEENGGNERR